MPLWQPSPFQKEKTPSFTVVPDKGFYHCFSTGEHGDCITWLMKMEGLSFPEAVEKLALEAGLQMPRSSPEERQRAEKAKGLHEALEAAAEWFAQQLNRPSGEAALQYLKGRGLTGDTIDRFRLGYAPNERGLLRKTLNARGFNDKLLAEAGLIKIPEEGGTPRDYFFDRVIFPITDRRGQVIAFGGRALSKDTPAKYLNSPDTPVFHKGRVLYNLDKARKGAHDTGEVIVCEGYMDVIALAQAGFPAAVAPLGTAVTEQQIEELWRMTPEPVICLDGDLAGQKAAFRAAERALPILKPGKSLTFAFLPAGEDPDSLVQSQGPQALRVLLDHAKPLAEVIWLKETAGKTLDTPERRAGLRQNLFQAVAVIEDKGVQEAYKTEMLQRFDAQFVKRTRFQAKGRRDASAQQRAPALPLAGRQSPQLLRQRQEAGLVAAVLNHVEVLGDELEDLSGLELSSPDLRALTCAILDCWVENPDLDAQALQRHLNNLGLAEQMTRVLAKRTYDLCPFARPDAEPEWVKARWQEALSAQRDRQGEAEKAEAARFLAEKMNDEALKRLDAHKQLLQDSARRPLDENPKSER